MLWLLLTSFVLLLIYYILVRRNSYWEKRGVVHLKPLPSIGNMSTFIFQIKSAFDCTNTLYKLFENERYFGLYWFNQPALCVRDPELLKNITIRDFDHFIDHNAFIPRDVDPLLDKTIGNLKGQRWRDVRAILSSLFTSSKIKTMFIFASNRAEEFTKYIENQNPDIVHVQIKDAFTRLTNDVIASVAFGVQCNSLENPMNEFYIMGKKAATVGKLKTLLFSLYNVFPTLSPVINFGFLPTSATKFFNRLVKEIIKAREYHDSAQSDLINLLLKARKENHIEDYSTSTSAHTDHTKRKLDLTDDDITAQALIFFLGGFESTAILMSFISYELAMNLDIQVKLQIEIDKTLKECNNKLTYEGLQKMKYMDMVVSETLRKWPPSFQTDRICVKDYRIKPTIPNETELIVEKGTVMLLPIVGIHRDSKYYPDPEKFDPERFSDENNTVNPIAYIPFGSGPRSCVAPRFSTMEAKTVILHLLSKFNIIPIDRTPVPLELAKGTLNIYPEKGFWLGLKRRILA